MHALSPSLVTLGALAAYGEAFRATSDASHHEIRAEARRMAPTDSPDGRRHRRRPGKA